MRVSENVGALEISRLHIGHHLQYFFVFRRIVTAADLGSFRRAVTVGAKNGNDSSKQTSISKLLFVILRS